MVGFRSDNIQCKAAVLMLCFLVGKAGQLNSQNAPDLRQAMARRKAHRRVFQRPFQRVRHVRVAREVRGVGHAGALGDVRPKYARLPAVCGNL